MNLPRPPSMDKEKVWQTVLENLKLNLSSANFATWFPQTFVTGFKKIAANRQITEIGCPNLFARNTIENRYYGLIKTALDQATGMKNDVVFTVKQSSRPPFAKATVGQASQKEQPLFEGIEERPEVKEAVASIGLRPDFNFETFAVSSTNQMAHAAAQAVAQSPGKAYNPLFLYGGVGVGKTHLMQAIGNAVLSRHPRTKIISCTGEEFTNEIVDAIRKKTTDDFKQKYRTAKILMVDDIQFIAGKEKIQEEFFHTFNAILRVGGQIVLTSDRRPEEISKLEDRLRSRFEGGLTIDIQPPDFELRTAILLIKAQQRGIKMPMDVAQLIAGNITSIRRMEGFLTRLSSEIQMKNIPISPELVQALLGQASQASLPKKLVKPKEMVKSVAFYFNLKVGDLTGPKRNKIIVVPRQILMYLLRTEFNTPLMEIGQLLGDRDHTTVMHGVDKITKLLPSSEDMRVDIAEIKKRLYA